MGSSESRRLRFTLNGEEREVGPGGTAACLLLAVPAFGMVLVAVVVCLVACVLAIPAMAVGWALSRP